ncbi:hypothetical protein [Shumkonia mesophila]|uniref:hypothetical protein n=1 Tax=Shumkonia mesophila TaxID=2838854 RepID=UPI002934E6B7|nr:hypothetical protein [Shumkonia mesophila]
MTNKSAPRKIGRSATSGKIIHSGGQTVRGGDIWVVASSHGSQETIITSPSSAASIKRIAKANAKALERLAKK